MTSPSFPVCVLLRDGSDFTSTVPPSSVLVQSHQQDVGRPGLPHGALREKTHLSMLHALQVLTDAMLTELLRALFTVIVFGCTLGSIRIRRAFTSVGYTRAQCQGLRFYYKKLSISISKKCPHCKPILLMINQHCSFVSCSLGIKFSSSPSRALSEHVIFANQLRESPLSFTHRLQTSDL